jgi:hypothetical protein
MYMFLNIRATRWLELELHTQPIHMQPVEIIPRSPQKQMEMPTQKYG